MNYSFNSLVQLKLPWNNKRFIEPVQNIALKIMSQQ